MRSRSPSPGALRLSSCGRRGDRRIAVFLIKVNSARHLSFLAEITQKQILRFAQKSVAQGFFSGLSSREAFARIRMVEHRFRLRRTISPHRFADFCMLRAKDFSR